MLKSLSFNQRQYSMVWYWLPVVASGLASLLAFIIFGQTPPVRAAGLASAVVGIALALRRFSGLLAFVGGLALAFSPAFWSQTGGRDSDTLSLIALVLLVAAAATLMLTWFGRPPSLGLAVGVIIFAVLFWLLVGTPRSLRLTTFMSAWVFFLLIDALLTANPRADDPAPVPLKPRHTWGLLLLLALGVMNDSLFTLVDPAVALGLWLSRARMHWWYWLLLTIIAVVGLWGIADRYLSSTWWVYSAASAEAQGLRVPFMMADGWRLSSRWLMLINLVITQFTLPGLLLGILGLARLARWYPPVGVVTMIAYAGYALFGLVYFGRDNAVLLLPLLMIQVIWMTYAVHSFSHWLQKSLHATGPLVRWAAPAAFALLPLVLFLQIAGGV